MFLQQCSLQHELHIHQDLLSNNVCKFITHCIHFWCQLAGQDDKLWLVLFTNLQTMPLTNHFKNDFSIFPVIPIRTFKSQVNNQCRVTMQCTSAGSWHLGGCHLDVCYLLPNKDTPLWHLQSQWNNLPRNSIKTFWNDLNNMKEVRFWRGLQTPQIPIQLIIHRICLNYGQNRQPSCQCSCRLMCPKNKQMI